jgi:hypothetical protein
MTRKAKIIIDVIAFIIFLFGALWIAGLAGCTQRIYQHDITDPNGVSHTYYYQSNSLMSDTSADEVEIVLKDGTVLRIRKPLQDNDSVKMLTPWGLFESKPGTAE